MALDAFLNIANACFGVHPRHLGLAMVVAAVAVVGRIVGGVTRLAGRLFAFVAMFEWKAVSDETCRSPACRGVTRGAIGAELSAVDRRVGVALHTLVRCVAEAIVDVTFGASDMGVLEFERKDGGVIESLQAVAPIVARETCLSHGRAMVCDKPGVLEPVTIRTRGQHCSRFIPAALCRGGMTGTACQRLSSVIALMARKTKAELVVRQFHKRCLRQAGGASFVIRMTRGTVSCIGELAVQSLQARRLIADVAVAIHTTGSVRPAKRGMAQVALRFEIRVRGHVGDGTTQRMFCAERARAEGGTAKKGDAPTQTD